MHITSLNISTKKGDSQDLRFLIVHSIPYPVVNGSCGRLTWQNGEGLFPLYGNPAQGLPAKFHCYQLTPGGDVPEDYNRTHFAGVQNYTTKIVNPGAVILRGKDLGELLIRFDANPTWPEIKVRGGETPSPSEREAITSLIVPHLVKYIANHAGELRADAIRRIKERFDQQISEARQQIAELEKEAAKTIENLTKGGSK